MNPPKADELDYVHFLIAAQKVFTCTEAARSAPEKLDPPAHDAFTRLLRREPPQHRGLVGRGENAGRARTRAFGSGRHHSGQALLQEEGASPPPLVWQASPGGQRDQPLHPTLE